MPQVKPEQEMEQTSCVRNCYLHTPWWAWMLLVIYMMVLTVFGAVWFGTKPLTLTNQTSTSMSTMPMSLPITSTPIPMTTSLPGYSRLTGDCGGNDLNSGLTVSLEECAALCTDDVYCPGFVFIDLALTPSNYNSCWLKTMTCAYPEVHPTLAVFMYYKDYMENARQVAEPFGTKSPTMMTKKSTPMSMSTMPMSLLITTTPIPTSEPQATTPKPTSVPPMTTPIPPSVPSTTPIPMTAPLPGYYRAAGDCKGNDMGPGKMLPLQDCAALCTEDTSCRGFVYIDRTVTPTDIAPCWHKYIACQFLNVKSTLAVFTYYKN